MSTYSRVSWVSAAIVSLSLLGGCAAPTVTEEPASEVTALVPTPKESIASQTPQPAPPPAELDDAPLLRMSATVTDPQGGALDIVLSIVDVAPPTEQDVQELRAAPCPTINFEWLSLPDTRIVTVAVSASAPGGFSGWSHDSGVYVRGEIHDGAIWSTYDNGYGWCQAPLKLSGPGSGTVKVVASSAEWKVQRPVPGSSAATLVEYGFSTNKPTATGQVNSLSLSSCTIEIAPEFERWAALASEAIPWRETSSPGVCGMARALSGY